MNNTGKSVQTAVHFFKIEPEEIIIIHDDLELAFEKIVLKRVAELLVIMVSDQ